MAACGDLLLDQTEAVGQFGVKLDAFLDIGVELVAGLVEGEQALLLLQLGEFRRLHQLVKGLYPPLILLVGHLGADIETADDGDRKSTRLNSSHVKISYAVFCLKEKK